MSAADGISIGCIPLKVTGAFLSEIAAWDHQPITLTYSSLLAVHLTVLRTRRHSSAVFFLAYRFTIAHAIGGGWDPPTAHNKKRVGERPYSPNWLLWRFSTSLQRAGLNCRSRSIVSPAGPVID